MNFLIIEDEAQAGRRLQRQILTLMPDAQIGPILTSVQEAVDYLSSSLSFDLIFMDIHLSDGDSFEILDQIELRSPIIFTTAYDSYALQAFKANSIDYLLKPIRETDLQSAIHKWQQLTGSGRQSSNELVEVLKEARGNSSKAYLQRILIRFPEKIKAIEVSEAAYFHVESRVTLMQLFSGKQYPVDFNLDQLEDRLPPKHFFRANRKFIIHVNAIHQMHKYSKSRLKLDLNPPYDGDIYISSEKSAAFKKWLMGI